tara:strand:+ start:2676 stop:2873 length:198 start_codon:yes stop_codon:yes gene_type:complete
LYRGGYVGSELRNIRAQYFLKIVPHIEIKKNGHSHLTQLNERALAILDERTKSCRLGNFESNYGA